MHCRQMETDNYVLFAAVWEGDGVGALQSLAVGFLVPVEVRSLVVVVDVVVEVVRQRLLLGKFAIE